MNVSATHAAKVRVNRDNEQIKLSAVAAEMNDIYLTRDARPDKVLLASEMRQLAHLKDQKAAHRTEVAELNERIVELDAMAISEEASAETMRKYGPPDGPVTGWNGPTPRGGDIYRPGGEHSFFRDIRNSKLGDPDAGQRLVANANELRAMGNTGAVGGSGGEWAPPLWLVEEFVALARAGRVLADRTMRQTLPDGVSTIDVPKVTTGSATAVQSTQNTALADTDPTTTFLQSGITSIGGKVVVAQQLIDQSAIRFDQFVLGDLAADYARSLDLQVISGSGTAGQLLGVYTYFAASGTSNVTYTQATPAVAGAGGFYATINKAISQIATTRFLPPTAIVMHPRRWSWVAASFDANGRPLVSPSGNAFNQIADAGTVAAQGPVGQMAGLPVYVDPNIPINLGAGTNQDPVFVGKWDDLWLWEKGPQMASFAAPYADSAGVLFRALGYSAFIPSRYASSVSVITGSGLVSPSY